MNIGYANKPSFCDTIFSCCRKSNTVQEYYNHESERVNLNLSPAKVEVPSAKPNDKNYLRLYHDYLRAYQEYEKIIQLFPGLNLRNPLSVKSHVTVMQYHKALIKHGKSKQVTTTITPVPKPQHSQEKIQDYIIKLWIEDPQNDYDLLKATYMQICAEKSDGWCDGWSYLLSILSQDDVDKLITIWKEIDQLCLNSSHTLSVTDIGTAIDFARRASRYHVINNDPPSPPSSIVPLTIQQRRQYDAYQTAGFGRYASPSDSETWKNDKDTELTLHGVIKSTIKKLKSNQTLRLTSPTHDVAVRKKNKSFIVCETENYGIQRCSTINEVLQILQEWKSKCEDKKSPIQFFTQYMIVG